MEVAEIKELLRDFDNSRCSSFSYSDGSFSLTLSKCAVDGAKVETSSDDKVEKVVETRPMVESGEIVKSPLVGVFYAAPSPEEEAYVQVGSAVKKGQILCLVEAMKMMSEITAPRDGVVKKIFVKNQDVVGFEDSLFLIGE